MSTFNGSLAETYPIVRLECKRELLLFVQSFKECRRATTTFCINYAKIETKAFNIPDHYETSFRRFEPSHVSSVLKSLKEMFKLKTESHGNGRSTQTTSQNKQRRLSHKSVADEAHKILYSLLVLMNSKIYVGEYRQRLDCNHKIGVTDV